MAHLSSISTHMTDNASLFRQYRELLLDGIVPFWERHGLDPQHGGVLSCMEEDGTPISGDKYIWSQARWAWVCSALYNRVEKRPEFLAWARSRGRLVELEGGATITLSLSLVKYAMSRALSFERLDGQPGAPSGAGGR